MDSSILVLGEITGGILLAYVPMAGPLFFSDRKIKPLDRNQHVEGSLETIGSKPTRRRKTLGSTLVDSLFSPKMDTECPQEELEDGLLMRALMWASEIITRWIGIARNRVSNKEQNKQMWCGKNPPFSRKLIFFDLRS
jgi:hypothetical protein